MATDAAGQVIGKVRCTASGQERSWDREAWASSDPVMCPDCGAVGDLCWVRMTDLAPRAKVRAHKAPEGVTPAPYAAQPRGGGKVWRR